MSDVHKDILKRNRVFIIKHTEPNSLLFSSLLVNDVLTDTKLEELNYAIKSNYAKVSSLLDFLVKRGPHAFEYFIQALLISDNELVALQLDPGLVDKYRAPPSYEEYSQQQRQHYPDEPPPPYTSI